ncbi:hypothetical protein JTE90_004364 [Oedothorax gibbosus]|uniref:Peptidase A2 domain-containing protein n=1 Tax=Oedothorax gibbosus TaxID=931172 RepID=A0AAV6VKL1_9ARAC|nr:hypothetical protein JTE90_004364 [Oedothorax gibbosus]
MSTKTKAVSITVPAHHLFEWITTEGSLTGGVTYKDVKKFVESDNYSSDAKALLQELLETGQLERVGRKYVIPGKKQTKRDRQNETNVNKNGAKTDSEKTGKILKSHPMKKVKRPPIIVRVRPITGNISNTNARIISGGNSAEINAGTSSATIKAGSYSSTINAGPSSATINAGSASAMINTGPSISKKNVKRPNDEDIQRTKWMWNQDVFINNKQINFKLDTGAQANILPLYSFNDLKLYENSFLYKSNSMISAFGNFLIETEGVVTLLCSTESVSNVELQFLVVDLPALPILGLNGCEELKLIKRTDSKN